MRVKGRTWERSVEVCRVRVRDILFFSAVVVLINSRGVCFFFLGRIWGSVI